MKRAACWMFCSLLILIAGPTAEAKVARIDVRSRLPYAEGRAFDGVGPYQRLLGRVYFTLDPQLPANQNIIDLPLAPRNEQGLVEFSADLEILAPVDLTKVNGTLLYDVNNRGRRLALSHFNTGADEFLMRQGYIVVWSGWIAETLPVDDLLRMQAPVATQNGQPLTSLVRTEMVPAEPCERMTIAQWANQGCYEPTEAGLAKATLTWRERESDPRVPIPREQWKLEQKWVERDGERGQLPLIECAVAGGMRAGYIYELIYEAQNPVVQGCGLAGIRDLVAHLKFESGEGHPLRLADGTSAAKRTIGYGVSQSGRCLRLMLYDGFNAPEPVSSSTTENRPAAKGPPRMVFDGMIPHVAGGGLGFFNHRFAMPTRHNGQHDNHLYPTDVFPFAYGMTKDPFTNKLDSVLRVATAERVVPKIMHTQTSAEYWHRSGSLVHTDPLGQSDVAIPENVRIYAHGGAQHSSGNGQPQPTSAGQSPLNPTDCRPLMRAVLAAMDAWVREGRTPPPSVYPQISNRTLVGWSETDSGWNALPGIRYPQVIQRPQWLDYGPEFAALRWITQHPPRVHQVTWNGRPQSTSYGVLVPAFGPDNNERGMVLLPTVSVPVATFTGWNLRSRQAGAESELFGLMGSYIPLCQTAAERESQGDPRPALLERYGDYDHYLRQYTAAAERLVADRYLLAEDLHRVMELAKNHKELFDK